MESLRDRILTTVRHATKDLINWSPVGMAKEPPAELSPASYEVHRLMVLALCQCLEATIDGFVRYHRYANEGMVLDALEYLVHQRIQPRQTPPTA